MRKVIVAAIVLAGLTACVSTPVKRTRIIDSAPRVSEFRFDDTPPLSAAADFAPWAGITAEDSAAGPVLDSCFADRKACPTGWLLRYRRLLELSRDLTPDEQLRLVHEYFNSVEQTLEGGAEHWASLFRTASTNKGDCKAIALGKYFTLRRLGWPAEDLRVLMEWDERAGDWHALLAVHDADRTYILDSILGLQRPQAFRFAYMVYSISEQGLWDHAPDFVPVP